MKQVDIQTHLRVFAPKAPMLLAIWTNLAYCISASGAMHNGELLGKPVCLNSSDHSITHSMVTFLKLILLSKPAAQAQVWKTMLFISAFATSQAHAPRKIEENTIHGRNQRLTAPLNPSSFLVSNKVSGRSFTGRAWADRKHLANWDVLHLDTPNSNGWGAVEL